MAKQEDSKIDTETGEVVTSKSLARVQYEERMEALAHPPSKNKEVTSISSFHADQPPNWNLKEHPDLDGAEIVIMSVEWVSGTQFGDFIKMYSYVYPNTGVEGFPVVLRTFSEFIIDAIMPAIETISPETPVKGTLRLSGRSWLLE